jgi:hypothetical protein
MHRYQAWLHAKIRITIIPRHRALVYLLRFDAGIDHSVLP